MIQLNLARSKQTGRFCTNTNLMAFLSINRNKSTCVLSVGGFVHVEHVSERNQGACSTWRQHGRIRGFNARGRMFVSADINKKKAHPVRLKYKEHFYRNKTTVMILNLLVKLLFFCSVFPFNPPQNGCVRTEASVRSAVEPFKGLFHPCLEHTTDYCLTTRRVKGPVNPKFRNL